MLSASSSTVLWLEGEHDIANVRQLSVTLARAIAADDADLIIVDMSGVEFLGASTVGAIVRARDITRSANRSLVVRSPSPRAMRVLNLCGLAELVVSGELSGVR
jgi:anti-anti-sigma factor